MSFLFGGGKSNKPQPQQKLGGIDEENLGTNEEGIPLPYLAGVGKLGVKWITPCYDIIRTPIIGKTGKKSSGIVGYLYFADLAGAICVGPVDEIMGIYADNELVWSGSITRGSTDYTTISIPNLTTMRFYWGTETQPVDTLSLTPPPPPPVTAFDPRAPNSWLSVLTQKVTITDNSTGGDLSSTPNMTVYWGYASDGLVHWVDQNGYELTPTTPYVTYNYLRGATTPYDKVRPTFVPSPTVRASGSAREVLPTTIGHFDPHPRYKGVCYCVCEMMFFGRDRNNAPNLEFYIRRDPKPTSRSSALGDGTGTFPGAVMDELLTNPRFGLGLPSSVVDATSTNALDTALSATGFRFSPQLTSLQSFRELASSILEYFDGWIRLNGSIMQFGYFDHGAVNTTGLLSLDDDALTEEPQIDTTGLTDAINHVQVTFNNQNRKMKQDVAEAFDEASLRQTGEPRTTAVQRPWFTVPDVVARYAQEYVRIMSQPRATGTVKVLREKVATLVPGMRFILNLTRLGSSVVMRVVGKKEPEDNRGDCELTVENEPGIWPSLYVPPTNAALAGFVVSPVNLTEVRIVELPAGLKLTNKVEVLALAERPNAFFTGFYLHVSETGSTYEKVGEQPYFATSGPLLDAYVSTTTELDTAVGFRVKLFGPDRNIVESQTDAARGDNTLLCFVNGEIISVGTVTALGNYEYRVYGHRGRFGTDLGAHAVGSVAWFIPRYQVTPLSHQLFTPTATRFFKLQPHTQANDLDLADAVAQTFTFLGNATAAPTGVTLSTLLRAVTSSSGFQSTVVVQWSFQHNQGINEFEVAWRIQGSTTWTQRKMAENYFEFAAQPNTVYEVRVRAFSTENEPSLWTTLQTITSLSEFPVSVSSLALVSGGTTFAGRDAQFSWVLANSGVVAGTDHPLLRDYQVQIYDSTGTTLLRTDYVTAARYVYTADMNARDNAGVAKRSFQIQVRCRSTDSSVALTTAATLTVSNPAPSVPTSQTFLPRLGDILFGCTQPSDVDFVGLILWRSNTSGFTPATGNRVVKVNTGTQVFVPTLPGTWYFRFAAYDTFGDTEAELNISPQYTVTQSGRIYSPDDTTAPTAPTALTASASFRNISLQWTPGSELDIWYYEIWRNTSNDRSTATLLVKVDSTRHVDAALATSTTFYYWVRAIDTAGNIGAWSNGTTSGASATTDQAYAADIANGTITPIKIVALEASKITAGNMSSVNLSNSGKLFNASYPTRYFESNERALVSGSQLFSGTSTAWAFTHISPAQVWGVGHTANSHPMFQTRSGYFYFLYLAKASGWSASRVTLYYRLNGSGSYVAIDNDSLIVQGFTAIAVNDTDRVDFYLAPCNTSGVLYGGTGGAYMNYELTIVAFNW